MTAPKQVDFVDGVTVVAADFLDRIQEIQSGLAINMALSISGTSLVLPAGTGNDVSSITIGEKFRYLETPQNLSFSGSDSAGTYGIWATTTATDSNPSFSLAKVAGAGSPVAAYSRKIATVSWDGSSTLSNLVQLAGYDKHGHMHTLAGDPLPASSVGSSQIVDNSIVFGDLATALQNLLVPVGSVFPYAGTTAPAQYVLCDGSEYSQTTYSALFSAISTTYNRGDETAGFFRIPDLRGRVPAGRDNMGGTAANRLTNAGAGITGTTLGASGGVQTHTLTSSESGMPAHSTTNSGAHIHGTASGADGLTGAAGGHDHGMSGAGGHDHQWGYESGGVAAGTSFLTVRMNGGGSGVNWRTSGVGDHGHTIYGVGNHDHTIPTTNSAHSHSVTAVNASGAHQNTQPTLVLNYIIRF